MVKEKHDFLRVKVAAYCLTTNRSTPFIIILNLAIASEYFVSIPPEKVFRGYEMKHWPEIGFKTKK